MRPQPDSSEPATDTASWLATRLGGEAELWERLGFDGQDLADVRAATAALLAGGAREQRRVVDLATRLAGIVGRFTPHKDVFEDMEGEAFPTPGVEGHGWGVLGVLAFAASLPAVRAFHRERGIPGEIAWLSLGDLSQQVRVHRRTYGEFGLHALPWLTTAWSGALYRLGRLQFNLHWYEPEGSAAYPVADPAPRWVLSTHIPATGALDPADCDASFERARAFFAQYFPDHPATEFHCDSWLLDPRLTELSAGSNTARFQARWRLEGEGADSNAAAYFFIWGRRGDVDPATLTTDSSLRRLVRSEILAGRPWRFRPGLIQQ